MPCKDYGLYRYKPTLSKPGLGQGKLKNERQEIAFITI
jgi:hypothetical protein